jgi:hypothetical protein
VEQLIEFAGNHPVLVAGFAAVLLLLIWTEVSRYTRGYMELTPGQAVQKINQGNTTIVDISTAADFSKGHLAGAKHSPPGSFEAGQVGSRRCGGTQGRHDTVEGRSVSPGAEMIQSSGYSDDVMR